MMGVAGEQIKTCPDEGGEHISTQRCPRCLSVKSTSAFPAEASCTVIGVRTGFCTTCLCDSVIQTGETKPDPALAATTSTPSLTCPETVTPSRGDSMADSCRQICEQLKPAGDFNRVSEDGDWEDRCQECAAASRQPKRQHVTPPPEPARTTGALQRTCFMCGATKPQSQFPTCTGALPTACAACTSPPQGTQTAAKTAKTARPTSRAPASLKTCTSCGVAKPRGTFYKNSNHRDGRNRHCPECCRAYRRSYSDARRAARSSAHAASATPGPSSQAALPASTEGPSKACAKCGVSKPRSAFHKDTAPTAARPSSWKPSHAHAERPKTCAKPSPRVPCLPGAERPKTCSKCRVVKLRSDFSKSSHSKDGLRRECRECNRAYCRSYLAAQQAARRSAQAGPAAPARLPQRAIAAGTGGLKTCTKSPQHRYAAARRPISGAARAFPGGTDPAPASAGQLKVCRRCQETKPLGAFHRMRSSRDGLQYHCKSCKAAVDKQRQGALGSGTTTVRQPSPAAPSPASSLQGVQDICLGCGALGKPGALHRCAHGGGTEACEAAFRRASLHPTRLIIIPAIDSNPGSSPGRDTPAPASAGAASGLHAHSLREATTPSSEPTCHGRGSGSLRRDIGTVYQRLSRASVHAEPFPASTPASASARPADATPGAASMEDTQTAEKSRGVRQSPVGADEEATGDQPLPPRSGCRSTGVARDRGDASRAASCPSVATSSGEKAAEAAAAAVRPFLTEGHSEVTQRRLLQKLGAHACAALLRDEGGLPPGCRELVLQRCEELVEEALMN
eukprot:jgi/Tetstr1/423676/TSEL_014310.t1